MENLYTLIPKIDVLLEDQYILGLIDEFTRERVLEAIREELNEIRLGIKNKGERETILDRISKLDQTVEKKLRLENTYKLKKLINATGTIIHTNLGRSPLNEEILDNIREVTLGYSNLEYDLEKGERGSRYDHLEAVICKICKAEAAMVVNNNAAALMLILNTISRDREIIVSRGELIEIGGSFRIPEVMEQGGCKLVEVGTTNKTHLRDYEGAIGEETAAILKVHTSNYRIQGFTSSVEAKDLRGLSSREGILLVEDLGSGVLIDLNKFGLEHEPTVQESVEAGIDIVCFSGDKLLGGPQAGIIVGKREYIDRMKTNPLTRAFRVDKFTIAALEVIFSYYLDEKKAIEKIPTLRMLAMDIEDIARRAEKMKDLLGSIDNGLILKIEDGYSEVGGGSLPLERMKSKLLAVELSGLKSHRLERELRRLETPIIVRINNNKLYMDLRTIGDSEIDLVVRGIKEALDNIRGEME